MKFEAVPFKNGETLTFLKKNDEDSATYNDF